MMAADVLAQPVPFRGARATHPSRPVFRALDRFFRRQDTWLARGLTRLSSRRGLAYAGSFAKRTLDLLISIPAALFVLLLVVLLVLANKLLYPGQPTLFVQDRVGPGGSPLRVVKIRSMRPGADSPDALDTVASCTMLGRVIRRYYLDELPQLLQVAGGQLSLVGIRVLPREVHDGLHTSWSARRFEAWRTMYESAPLGLTGLHQVMRRTGKEDEQRFHRDMFYARHASLGLDLYLLWRTFGTRDSGESRATSLSSPSVERVVWRHVGSHPSEARVLVRSDEVVKITKCQTHTGK